MLSPGKVAKSRIEMDLSDDRMLKRSGVVLEFE
jgi:hypothetical protein